MSQQEPEFDTEYVEETETSAKTTADRNQSQYGAGQDVGRVSDTTAGLDASESEFPAGEIGTDPRAGSPAIPSTREPEQTETDTEAVPKPKNTDDDETLRAAYGSGRPREITIRAKVIHD